MFCGLTVTVLVSIVVYVSPSASTILDLPAVIPILRASASVTGIFTPFCALYSTTLLGACDTGSGGGAPAGAVGWYESFGYQRPSTLFRQAFSPTPMSARVSKNLAPVLTLNPVGNSISVPKRILLY